MFQCKLQLKTIQETLALVLCVQSACLCAVDVSRYCGVPYEALVPTAQCTWQAIACLQHGNSRVGGDQATHALSLG